VKDDTRKRRAAAFIDDARTSIVEAGSILSGLTDEVTDDHLEAARFMLNGALKHLDIWEAS
jgi:hypothetical protein